MTLQAGELAQLDELRTRFAPKPETLPTVKVDLPSLCGYDALLATPSEPANQPVNVTVEVLP